MTNVHKIKAVQLPDNTILNIDQSTPIVTTNTYGTINLKTNCVYSVTSAGSISFALPSSVDNTEFNQILVQLNMPTVCTINVGTIYFFNKTAPDLSEAGAYDLIWEYDKANNYWVCGLLAKGSENGSSGGSGNGGDEIPNGSIGL